jgi:hypothetical protein
MFPVHRPALPNQSSESVNYWRFISDTNNYLSPSLASKLSCDRPISYLTVRVYNMDGTPASVASTDFLQLFLWSKNGN